MGWLGHVRREVVVVVPDDCVAPAADRRKNKPAHDEPNSHHQVPFKEKPAGVSRIVRWDLRAPTVLGAVSHTATPAPTAKAPVTNAIVDTLPNAWDSLHRSLPCFVGQPGRGHSL